MDIKAAKNIFEIETPAFVIDEKRLMENGRIIKEISDRTGARFLLAQKAFSGYDLYPVISEYAYGTEASGLFEARLGHEEMPGKECHVFCAAYRQEDIDEICRYADHIVFNSPTQLKTFGKRAKEAGLSVGLRINPECSTQEGHGIYDPCAPKSRLGTTRDQFDKLMTAEDIELLDGIHFHTLCEQGAEPLKLTVDVTKKGFGDILPKMKWINLGGGHHVSKSDYNRDLLADIIRDLKTTYNAEIYLEPGEAFAIDAGYLVTTVLDITENNGTKNVIVDMSAACHSPDILEVPFTPPLVEAVEDGAYKYRFGGPTCLAGDVIGDYAFDHELSIGEKLTFGDMAMYSMVKTNTFNGMPLPDIYVLHADDSIERLTHFGYEDFKTRLGS